ncbi:mandelate racemase/muconate lactonizing enzyme family protein [Laceyella putida]|uniref:Mandelate racemase/muconate lactonizing enzyme family protein n=1 Tax=Laceyella putida TaxID=110101 RepID=A0ABW2RGY7_9BACL
MLIQQVDLFPLYYPLAEPYGDANGYKGYRTCFLIQIRTQSGLEGWGECVDWLPTLEKGFRQRIIPFLLGKKATDRTHLISTIQRWHNRSATAVSMALTEILARHANCSVCDLWGGRLRKHVPVYASFQSYTERPDWISHSLQQVDQIISTGFTAIKVKVGGKPFQEDQQHISRMLRLLDGQIKLAIDANQSYDPATALKWNSLFRQYDQWLWFEEPLPFNHLSAYAFLRSRSDIPVAGGENKQQPLDFLTLMQKELLDIIQPDPMHLGGIEAYRDTLQLARHHGVRVSPHTYDGFLARWYAILAHCCLPAWSKMAGEEMEPVEWDVMTNPFQSLLSVRPVNGLVTIPEGSGIGVEWDLERLESLLWDGTPYA